MGKSKIYVVRADGSHANQLTNASEGDSFEAWYSPSGKRITFSSNRDGSYFEAFVMNSDGSHQHRLTQTTHSNYPSGWGVHP
jgi:Tol biopolymer transport system component